MLARVQRFAGFSQVLVCTGSIGYCTWFYLGLRLVGINYTLEYSLGLRALQGCSNSCACLYADKVVAGIAAELYNECKGLGLGLGSRPFTDYGV